MDEPRPLPLADDFAYADAADVAWADASPRFTLALVAGQAIRLNVPEGEPVPTDEELWEESARAGTATIERLRAMLERLQWVEDPTSSCPVCHGWQVDGHEADCELVALLDD